MKKIRTTFWAILGLLLLSCVLSSQQTQTDIYKRPRQFERSRDYDAKHYRVELTFDLDEKIFWGTNTVTLTPLKNEFYTCVLDVRTDRGRC